MKFAFISLAALVAGLTGGCPLGPTDTTVQLVNNTSFPVDVKLYSSSRQNEPAATLPLTGTEIVESVPANSVISFSRDCDELQAIVIDDADLQIVGGIGPSQNTRVYREPDDFGCRDTLTFTFTASSFLTELEINFNATGN